jgi:hypothetical protein
MSADSRIRDWVVRFAVVWGLLSCGGVTQAGDEEAPDPDFLEYLGSWEETDETWLILSADMEETEESDNKDKVDGKEPAPNGEKLAELDDEN